MRANRCEGIYIQEVSGAPLRVVSWTQSFAEYKPDSREPLQMHWDLPANSTRVRLRAQALRRRLYYRMDAAPSAHATSFTWPTDILAALGVGTPEIGVIATGSATLDGSERDIYLPLRISSPGASSTANGDRSAGYRLIVLPGVEMKEVFLTLTDRTQPKAVTIKNGEPLGYGYYPADEPVEIPISGLRGSGFYHVEISATLKAGGGSSSEFWFYHAGR
jgi:hypothetical protein